jgi:hypothetical protein
MVGVSAAVPVAKEAVGSEGVIVGPLGRSRDREGHLSENPRLEDPLGTDERNPYAIQEEPLDEKAPRQYVAMLLDCLGEPLKGSCPDTCILLGIEHRKGAFSSRRDEPLSTPPPRGPRGSPATLSLGETPS